MTNSPTKQDNQPNNEKINSVNQDEPKRNSRKRNRKDSKDISSSSCKSSSAVGSLLAERAIKKGIKNVVFDRGGNIYHGRVKALAEAARNGGLKF